MSNDSSFEGWTSAAPTGRKLDRPVSNYVGSVRTHLIASPERLAQARKRMIEIRENKLDLDEYEVVPSFTDLHDPRPREPRLSS